VTPDPGERLRTVRPLTGRTGLARLFVDGVALVPAAVLLHLDALTVVDLALHRDVVAPLAVFARKSDLDALVIFCHTYSLALCVARSVRRGRSLAGEFDSLRSLTASCDPWTLAEALLLDLDDAAGTHSTATLTDREP